MIFINEILEATNYHPKSEDKFQWKCFGNFIYIVDFDISDEQSVSCNYDIRTGNVFEINLIDKTNNKFLKWIIPSHFSAYEDESIVHNITVDFCDDTNKYELINDEEKIMNEIKTLFMNFSSNNLEIVSFDLDDDVLISLTQIANNRNITLNQLIVEIFTKHITKLNVEQKY